MKTAIRFGVAASIAALAASVASGAPDLTSSLEFVCAPNVERWPSSEVCRHVPDLCLYQGKIYTSGGDWNNNGGPCPVFAIEPYSGTYVKEWTAGTESVYDFHEFSDGRLYFSAIDIKERDWDTQTEAESHEGSHFRREADGNWRNYETALGKGNITQWLNYEYQGYRVHNWDIAEYKGYTFLCGYGISGSTNWGETAMFNATPSLTSVLRGTGFNLRRFYSFLVFDDDIYNFTCQPASGSSFTSTAWEEWRWDDTLSEKQFVMQDASWDNIAPGVTRSMLDYFGGNNVWLWHPRKFGSRVLYILGHEQYNIAPVAAFSAVNQNHHVKATKIDLGSDDVRPYHIFISGNEVYIVAAQGTSSSTTVENSVWKSTDGVNFTKLFTFNATRPASAVCYVDGTFYFGMGANQYTKKAWGSLGTDISGRIYRIRLPQAPIKVTASAESVSMSEGETKTVSYTLSSAPATNMTLKVWGTGKNAYWAIDKKTLTFTPQNWSTPQSVSFSVEDFDNGSYTNALVCGTGGTDCDAASTVVKVSGRAFTPPSDPGAIVLYDTMTVQGTTGTAGSGVHILTDYVPKRNTVVRSKYTDDPDASPTQFLFCSREAENVNSYAWGAKMWNKNQARWDINTSQKYSWEYVVTNVSMFLEVKQCKATLTRLYDEYRYYLTNDVSMTGFNPQYKMSLFQSYVISGGNYGSWSSSFRGDFNYLQIFEEENNTEVLKHHFVPCVVSNTVKVCDIANNYKLYDIVKTSSGTATIGSGAKAIGIVMPDDATPVPGPDPSVTYGPLDATAFAKKMDVTFSGYSGTALADFPVLVRLSTAINGFSYGDFQKTNGGDLRFADSNGTLLPHEIDTWNPSGESTVWVKVPSLSGNGKITAHWGCANPPEVAAKDVWDDDYVGVWHLGESALPMKESSETSVNLTGANNGADIDFASLGIAGGAVDFKEYNKKRLLYAEDHDALDGFSACTLEAWTYQTSQNQNSGIFGKRAGFNSSVSYQIFDGGNGSPSVGLTMGTNSTSGISTGVGLYPSLNAWNHLVYTFDSGTVTGYRNGTAGATKSFPKQTVLAGTGKFCVGSFDAGDPRNFPGKIDEVRVSKTARSAAWVKATHDTIANADFATYAVDGAAPPAPVELDPVLVVTVASGATNTLSAITNVAAATWITNVVKRGAGTLVATGMPTSFNGLITVEAGVWQGGNSAGDFGLSGTVIDVKDGASLEFVSGTANVLSGKTVNLYGAKAASLTAKVLFSNSGAKNLGSNVTINLKDADEQFYVAKDYVYLGSGTIDLGGRELRVKSNANWRRMEIGATIVNGGSLVFDKCQFHCDGTRIPTFSADCASTATLKFLNGAEMNWKKLVPSNGWTLHCEYSTIHGNVNNFPSKTDYPGWDGPIVFNNNSNKVADWTGGYNVSNTVFNLKGPVSGSGALAVGPGWLNLHNADNTYAGAVTVKGEQLTSTVTNFTPILPGSGGIGLFNGAKCFPNASSVTFTDSARLQFMDDTVTQVGTNVVFAGGAGDLQTVSGGNQDFRPTIGRFTKTGAGTLEFSAPAAVAEGRVLAGTLKVTQKGVEGATLELMTIRQPQFATLEFASGTLFDLSDNIGVKVDNLVGSPTVTNSGVFGIMENWKLTDPSAVMTLKGENVSYGDQPIAAMLAFGEGATFTIANEEAFSNAVVAAGADGLEVARAHWVFGNSTLVNGMPVVIPQPAAGMKYRWELAVGTGNTTLRLKFAAASGYAAWIAEKGLTGDAAAFGRETNGIKNGVRYAFDIDPSVSTVGTPIIQVVRDANGNPSVQSRDLATGRDDVTFGILATPDLTDWSNAALVPMTKFATDGLWRPTASESSGYVFPSQMFFKYTLEIQE